MSSSDDERTTHGALQPRGPGGELVAWPAASGMQKLDAILSLEDPRAYVQAMRGDELLWLVKDIGAADCLPVLAFATGEQWQSFVDLDCWRGDRLSLEPLEEWLETSLAAGMEAATTLLHGVDRELLVMLLMHHATVHEKDIDTAEIPDSSDIFYSPDGEFVIEMPAKHPTAPLVERMLRLLYAQDLENARMILRAARWELPSVTEEDLLRWRTGRLEELGFPSREDAVALFELLAPGDAKRQILEGLDRAGRANARSSSEERLATALVLPDLGETPLVLHALDAIDDDAVRDDVRVAMADLMNALLVAQDAELGDLDEQREAAEWTLGALNLALEHVAGDDRQLAARVLERVWLRDVFRIGHSLGEGVRRRAARVLGRVTTRDGRCLLDPPMDEAVAAAARRPPRMIEGATREGHERSKPVRALGELRVLRAVVERAEAIATFLEERFGFSPAALDATELPGVTEDARAHLHASTLLLTALCNAAIGRGVSLEPLGPGALDLLAAGVARAGGGAAFGQGLRAVLAGAVSQEGDERERRAARHLQAWIDDSVEALEEALATARPGAPLDPRFIGSLLLVRE